MACKSCVRENVGGLECQTKFPEWVERQIVTFALANPGLGPRRLVAQVAQPNPFGELKASASGVLKVLHRLASGPASTDSPSSPATRLPTNGNHHPDRCRFISKPSSRAIWSSSTCFHIGRLSGTKGRVWQYTAIDVASSFVWAQVHRSPKANPSARYATALVRRVAKELAGAG